MRGCDSHAEDTQLRDPAGHVPTGRLEPAVTAFGTATALLQKKLAQDFLRFLTNFFSLFLLVTLEIRMYTYNR